MLGRFVAAACAVASLIAVLPAPALGAGRAEPAPARAVRPVPGEVVRTFRSGAGRFDVGGHAGVDLAARDAEPVRAAVPGVVSFVGPVAGTPFVVVAHGDGVRTTYAPVRPARVRRGDLVAAGDPLGALGGPPPGDHAGGVLHFGLRAGDRSLDPLLLFQEVVPGDLVRLVPAGDAARIPLAGAGTERAWLLGSAGGGSGGPARIPWWMSGGGSTGRSLWSRARGAVSLVRRIVDAGSPGLREWIGGAVRDVGSRLSGAATRLQRLVTTPDGLWFLARQALSMALTVAAVPATGAMAPLVGHLGATALWSVGEGVADYLRNRRECSRKGPPGRAPENRRLVAVGGSGSARGEGGEPPFELPDDRLGYAADRVEWFSYAPGGAAGRPRASHAGLLGAAARLARDLRELRARDPDAVVDLVGHSQGGVVVEAFLKLHLHGHEQEFPRIGRVVTLAAPHRGVPLLRTLGELRPPVEGVWALAAEASDAIPGPGSVALEDLRPGSAFRRRLDAAPLPGGVDVTTVAAVDDWLVPAPATGLGGARRVVVDPAGVTDHGAVTSDPAAADAVRRALAGAPPACVSAWFAVRARIEPELLRAATDVGGTLVEAYGGPLAEVFGVR